MPLTAEQLAARISGRAEIDAALGDVFQQFPEGAMTRAGAVLDWCAGRVDTIGLCCGDLAAAMAVHATHTGAAPHDYLDMVHALMAYTRAKQAPTVNRDLLAVAVKCEAMLTGQKWRPDGPDLEPSLLREARAAITKATEGQS